MTATTATTPQAVSACLRRAGWVPTPRSFEGVHVTRSYKSVTVSCDWDSPVQSREQAELMIAVLNAAGYVTDAEGYSVPGIFSVLGRAA